MNTIIATATNNALVARHIEVISAKKGSALIGSAKALLIEEAKRRMRNGTCHFLYMKKDGSVREAFGTLNPALCGKHINGYGSSPESWGCTCYFDIEKGTFRSFRWQNIIDVLS
jgi:hypothetical protein